MMEYWSDGILGMAEWYLFLSEWHGSENKIGHNPLLIRKIPFFHSSKGGSSTFHYSMGFLTANRTPPGGSQILFPWS
jgi:hypothetical protein